MLKEKKSEKYCLLKAWTFKKVPSTHKGVLEEFFYQLEVKSMRRIDEKNVANAIEFLGKQKEYTVKNCNLAQLKIHRRNFIQDIINGQNEFDIIDNKFIYFNKDRFKVEPRECGLGKTHDVLVASIDKYTYPNQKGSIYVAKTKRSGQEMVKEINEAFGQEIAFAINQDTVESSRDIKLKLKIYPIIAITQRLYEILAKDKSMIKEFQKGRDLLILDEWFSLADIKTFSLANIKEIESQLANITLIELFREIIQELEKMLSIVDNKRHFFNAETDKKVIKKKINKLKKLVSENLDDDFLKRLESNKKSLIQEIEDIFHFFNGTCLIENYILYTVDRTVEYWKLDNNFILDASAKLNGAYELNTKLFQIGEYESVLDYSKWSIIRIDENSTISGRENYENYYKIVNKIADDLGRNDTLIVDNMDSIKNFYQGYKATYFAKLRSNNDYKTLKNVIIACTPYLPDREVVLEYLYFSGKTYSEECKDIDLFSDESEDYNWYGGRHGKIYELNNVKFEKYRKQLVASEMYQAIKRVNRDMTKETTVVIIIKDDEVFNMIVEMLPKCNIVENSKYNLEGYYFERKKIKRPFENESIGLEQEETYAEKTIALFKNILKGIIPEEIKTKNQKGIVEKNKYRKKAVGEFIGIDYSKKNASSIFCNKVLNKISVMDFMKANKIIAKGQYLYFEK